MDRYFLTSGQPDRSKTTIVVGISLPSSQHSVDEMRETVSKIAGLHHKTGCGPKTRTLFISWNSAAGSKAAEAHVREKSKAVKAEKEEPENERAELHADYLQTLKRKNGNMTYSPIGTYIIDCKEIERNWPEMADMRFKVRATDETGIFEASFDFGVVEGVMVLATDKKNLEGYRFQQRNDIDDIREDEMDDEEDGNARGRPNSKRKGPASRTRRQGRPSKKAKTPTSKSRKLHLLL
ncbi:hypothetical protein GGS21DRAFT_306733 [Xylaria nigripes]|nr:hypothetical protein GGS21DRAFT_306733 [Xylaria nigripes]